MIFGEIKTELALDGILSSSLVLYKDKDLIKVKKGTIINEHLINLLKMLIILVLKHNNSWRYQVQRISKTSYV